MRATIRDVAKQAGVSHTTVSWVIHNDPRITPQTKEKVLKVIAEMNYHPNYLARSLVRGRTNTIAVIASFFSSGFEIEILKGFDMGFETMGFPYNINLYSTRGSESQKDRLLNQILYGKMADSVILLSLKMKENMLKEFHKNQIPVVLIEEKMPDAHVVKTDNEKGAYLAVEYLIKKGKRKIGLFIGSLKGEESGLSPRERLTGYKKALKDYNIEYEESRIVEIEKYYFEDGQKALKSIIERKAEIDSIFCAAGDMVAMGVLRETQLRGIKVPDDLSIIGYDNIVTSSLVTPSLTTVKQPIRILGITALKMSIDAVENRGTERKQMVFEPELIVRNST